MSLAAMGGLSAAMSLVSGISQISASQSAAKAEEASADQAEREAGIVAGRASREAGRALRRGEEEADFERRTGRRLASTQQAAFGRAGVALEGSPMLVLSETIAEAETAALRSLRGGREAAGRITERGEDIRQARTFEAGQRRFRAKQTRKAGFIGAGMSLLTGGLRTASIFTPTASSIVTSPSPTAIRTTP